ncbi:MAG TPA: 2-phospho-L-lactate transferase CofD family protein, partial [Bryobacteraceae bacterium]|nr:2-phospho-L-lactate transferase CofD family protein [Bryobacteraceae bacterium]
MAAKSEIDPQVAAPARSKINVVLFSGGSGTQSITEVLKKHPQISLKILINAYDDGHSTGRLRRFVPGMLGPSDVRKNIGRLMPASERSEKSLALVSDFRLPMGIARAEALDWIDRIVVGDFALLPGKLAAAFPLLTTWQWRRLSSYLVTFRDYFRQQEEGGRTFDFTDCALGNLYFTGCYLEQGRDFNRAIRAFSECYEVGGDVLLNITQGENLFLVAQKENGSVLLNEADIVATQDDTKIEDLFLIDADVFLNRIENAGEPSEGWEPLLRSAHRVPGLNPLAGKALREADVIIYGPGTQHSSLFPSYMTEGVAEAIAANSKADKVFVGNIHRDFDIQGDDASDLARKLLQTMSRGGARNVEWLDVVSHFFVQGIDENTLGQAKYVPFDKSSFAFPLETVKVRDWEAAEGRHSGGYVLDELRQIVQSRIDIELTPFHHMVSIVIPVLNEEATVERVLKSVTALDFGPMSLSKEVLLIDGGSTDATQERARSVSNVRIYSLPPGRFGRGAAMRLGMEKARGNLIVFFPGDDEYRPE